MDEEEDRSQGFKFEDLLRIWQRDLLRSSFYLLSVDEMRQKPGDSSRSHFTQVLICFSCHFLLPLYSLYFVSAFPAELSHPLYSIGKNFLISLKGFLDLKVLRVLLFEFFFRPPLLILSVVIRDSYILPTYTGRFVYVVENSGVVSRIRGLWDLDSFCHSIQ